MRVRYLVAVHSQRQVLQGFEAEKKTGEKIYKLSRGNPIAKLKKFRLCQPKKISQLICEMVNLPGIKIDCFRIVFTTAKQKSSFEFSVALRKCAFGATNFRRISSHLLTCTIPSIHSSPMALAEEDDSWWWRS